MSDSENKQVEPAKQAEKPLSARERLEQRFKRGELRPQESPVITEVKK